MKIRIMGQEVETVIIGGKRHKLLDIDKKNEEVLVLHGQVQKWVSFSEVYLEKVPLARIGKNHIRLTKPGGPKKPKEKTSTATSVSVPPAT